MLDGLRLETVVWHKFLTGFRQLNQSHEYGQ